MVTGTMYATNPEELEIQMEVCMTLKEWKTLKLALSGYLGNAPAQDFVRLIQELVDKYEDRVYSVQGEDND